MTERRLAVLAGAGVLGLFILTRLLLLWRFPLFYDEAIYARWAFDGLEHPADRFDSLQMGIEPLVPWLGSIGMWLGAAPFTALRLVSLVAGLATVVTCGLIARDLGDWRDGLVAAALATIVPFFVVTDSIGILDPLATALVTVSVWLMIRVARRPALAEALLLGIALGAGLLTKRTTYSAVALLPASLLLCDWSPVGRRRRLVAWVGSVVLAVGVAYALYSVMRLSASWDEYVRNRDLSAHGAHSLHDALRAPWRWLDRNWPPFSTVLNGYVTIPILAAAAAGVVAGLRHRARLTAFVLLWFAVPFMATLLVAEIPYPRYLMVSIAPLVVLAAHGVVALFDLLERIPSRPARTAAAAVGAIVLLGPALLFDARVLHSPGTATYPGYDDAQYVTSTAALTPYEQIARDLRQLTGTVATDVVLGDFTSSYLSLAFHDDPHVSFVPADGGDGTCSSLYAVASDVPLQPRPDVLAWTEEKRYPGPRHGAENILYQAGVKVGGRVAITPDELRKLLRTDERYDAFGDSHACVHAWATAWYRLHGTG